MNEIQTESHLVYNTERKLGGSSASFSSDSNFQRAWRLRLLHAGALCLTVSLSDLHAFCDTFLMMCYASPRENSGER